MGTQILINVEIQNGTQILITIEIRDEYETICVPIWISAVVQVCASIFDFNSLHLHLHFNSWLRFAYPFWISVVVKFVYPFCISIVVLISIVAQDLCIHFGFQYLFQDLRTHLGFQ